MKKVSKWQRVIESRYFCLTSRNLLGSLASLAYRASLLGPRYFDVREPVTGETLRLWVRRDCMIERQFIACGLYGGWERVSLLLWACLAQRASTIVDIGANTGVYSVLARAVNPTATVLAIEPVEVNFEVLRRNIEANGNSIIADCCAVSDREGRAKMHVLKDRLSYISSLKENRYDRHPELTGGREVVEVEVETRTLDSLVRHRGLNGIDLMKIDVEGHEATVLESVRPMLAEYLPSVLVEVIGDDNAIRVGQLLGPLGYRFVSIDERSPPRVVDRIWDNDHHNFLACSVETLEYLGEQGLLAN